MYSEHAHTTSVVHAACGIPSVVMAAGAIVVMILLLFLYIHHPGVFNFYDHYQSSSLPYPSKIFVGREQEMSKLTSLLDFASDADIRIVNIVGSPGFGKSTLAIHLGNYLVKQGIVVHYINLAEYQEHEVQTTLAKKILKASEYRSKRYTFEDLLKWLRKLFWNSIIIIDDCDNLLQSEKESFFTALKKIVEQTPKVKVLMTSREVTTHIEYFKRYPVYELSTQAACELLEKKLPNGTNLTTAEIEEIARLTGNVPLALQIIGALLSSANPPLPSIIICELNSRPIQLLSHEEIPHYHRINVSISLSYRYLSPEMQRISRYLAFFPGSFDFDAAHAIFVNSPHEILGMSPRLKPMLWSYSNNVTSTLSSLISRSLIEYDSRTQRYNFHRLIKEFFRAIQINKTRQNALASNFQYYYSSLLTYTVTTLETNYRMSLLELHIERHNYKKLLDDLSNRNHDVESFSRMFAAIAPAVHKGIFNLYFSDEEIIAPLISAIEYIDELKLLFSGSLFSYLNFKLDFVHIVYQLSKAQKRALGTAPAIETSTKWKHVIDLLYSYSSNSLVNVYLDFYRQLASFHEELGNHNESKHCHAHISLTEGAYDT